MRVAVPVLTAFGVLVSVAACQTPTLTVRGIDGSTAVLSGADLAALPQQTIKTTDRGTPATFEGVRLNDVLAKVATPTGEKFHSTAASYYVLVEANDGYRAVFAWAELDPSFTDRNIYLVTKRDGKPLPDRAGPFQLLVPGEKRGARWVRLVKALTIKQAN